MTSIQGPGRVASHDVRALHHGRADKDKDKDHDEDNDKDIDEENEEKEEEEQKCITPQPGERVRWKFAAFR